MNTIEWLNSRLKGGPVYLIPEDYRIDKFAILDPTIDPVPDDAPPMPTGQIYLLLCARRDSKVAHYWLKEDELEDPSIDIWANIFPSISAQFSSK